MYTRLPHRPKRDERDLRGLPEVDGPIPGPGATPRGAHRFDAVQVVPVQRVEGPAGAAAAHETDEQVRTRLQVELKAEQDRLVAMKKELPSGFWDLGAPALVEMGGEIETYVKHNKPVPGINTIADAAERITRFRAAVDVTQAAVTEFKARIAFVKDLYDAYAGSLPGGGRDLAADIWAPLLGAVAPNPGLLKSNLARAESVFGGYISTSLSAAGGGALSAERKTELGKAFVRLWKMGKVTTAKRRGFDNYYKSSFDQNGGDMGVSWELEGIQGWVLHGHATLTLDGSREVTAYQLPRLHIKPSAAEQATGLSIEITDETIKQALVEQSRAHAQAIARSQIKSGVFRKQRVASEKRKKNRQAEEDPQ